MVLFYFIISATIMDRRLTSPTRCSTRETLREGNHKSNRDVKPGNRSRLRTIVDWVANFPLMSRAGEIENAVMILHGEKAHSFYFGSDVYKRLTVTPAKPTTSSSWSFQAQATPTSMIKRTSSHLQRLRNSSMNISENESTFRYLRNCLNLFVEGIEKICQTDFWYLWRSYGVP